MSVSSRRVARELGGNFKMARGVVAISVRYGEGRLTVASGLGELDTGSHAPPRNTTETEAERARRVAGAVKEDDRLA